MDKIFNSVHGLRTFQPFGFIAHNENVAPEKKEENEGDENEMLFSWDKELVGWINHDSGEILTDYSLTKKDLEMRKMIK